jgi:hypothetical protein
MYGGMIDNDLDDYMTENLKRLFVGMQVDIVFQRWLKLGVLGDWLSGFFQLAGRRPGAD